MKFKKMFKFPAYQYCFHCFLPQGDNLPPAHPEFRKMESGKRSCPLQDFVVLLILFIRYESDWWTKARMAFQSLPAQADEKELVAWCLKVETPENFYNGLELVLWFLTVHNPQSQ